MNGFRTAFPSKVGQWLDEDEHPLFSPTPLPSNTNNSNHNRTNNGEDSNANSADNNSDDISNSSNNNDGRHDNHNNHSGKNYAFKGLSTECHKQQQR